MDHHARRLVHHQQMLVLMHDLKVYSLGPRRQVRWRGLGCDADALAPPDLALGFSGFVVEPDASGAQPGLQAAA